MLAPSILQARLGLLLVLATGASACRNHGGLQKQYQSLRPQMVSGQWNQVAQTIQKSKDKVYKEEDRVMYWLNLGTAYHYAQQAENSMTQFVRAESTMQDLWTTSISSEASKFLVSESIQDYKGEDYEKILLYFYTVLNRLEQGKTQDALVEARRADSFLKKMQVYYDRKDPKGNKLGTLYTQDAFMLWMVGFLLEVEGSYNDAYLAYKASHKAYRTLYAGRFATPPPS